jgi:hypothetical protein
MADGQCLIILNPFPEFPFQFREADIRGKAFLLVIVNHFQDEHVVSIHVGIVFFKLSASVSVFDAALTTCELKVKGIRPSKREAVMCISIDNHFSLA